ncbi:hypothetical protein MLD38_025605 [Melastoma candidum]|uniref:Uncharacterized protein n=1 Tax=Melastoma candidum TaxID=119954 RepID=A0ACB9NYS4_9MYRT|nr:hypothetical protein MLD38_025605 [Melastoma candidum]
MKSGNTVLYAAYETPQPYWSMGSDGRMVKNQAGGSVTKSVLVANSWRFYDQSGSLLWQFIFSTNPDPNLTWIALLGNDGGISFTLLHSDGTKSVAETKIPANSCSTPLPYNPYSICYNNNRRALGDSTRNCYLLNDVGAFQVGDNTSGFSSFIKMSKGATGGSSNGTDAGECSRR